LAWRYKELMADVRFKSGRRRRGPQLTFTWVLWSEADSTELTFDPDTKHVYGKSDPGYGMHWDNNFEHCAALVPNGQWYTPAISTTEEEKHLRNVYSSDWTRNVPLGIARDAVTSEFVWTTAKRDEQWLIHNWNAGEPLDPPTLKERCAEYETMGSGNAHIGDKRWQSVDCYQPRYLFATCETDSWDYVAAINYVAASSDLLNAPFPLNVFSVLDAPGTGTTADMPLPFTAQLFNTSGTKSNQTTTSS